MVAKLGRQLQSGDGVLAQGLPRIMELGVPGGIIEDYQPDRTGQSEDVEHRCVADPDSINPLPPARGSISLR